MDTIEEFRDENTRLKATLAQIETENSQLENAISELEIEIGQANHNVEQLNDDKVKLQNDIQQLNDENVQLQSDLTQAVNDVQQLKNENAQLQSGLTQATRDKNLLAEDIKRRNVASILAAHELETTRGQLTQAINNRLTVAPEEEVSGARKDFIRRLVAIAVSAGFAGQIVTQIMSKEGIKPWEQAIEQWTTWTTIPPVAEPLLEMVCRLGTSMLVIVLGWDWYDRDLRTKPLKGIGRFILDVIIVSAELVLLLSASYPRLWTIVLVVIFGLYIVWDVFSIIDCRGAFGFPNERPKWWYAPWDIVRTYVGGWSDPLKRGPPINLIWFFYFGIVLVALPWKWPIEHMAALSRA
jgi:hypothetical protein